MKGPQELAPSQASSVVLREPASVVNWPPGIVEPTDPEDGQLSPAPPCERYYIHGRKTGFQSETLKQFAEVSLEPVRRRSPLLVHENASAELGKKRQSDYRQTLSTIQAAGGSGNITMQPLELVRMRINAGSITALAFSPDSRQLAVACGKSLQLWTTDPPVCVHNVEVVQGDLNNVHFSPDSKWICGSAHRLVLLFDVTSALRASTLAKHTAEIHSLTFASDSQCIFSVSQNGDRRKYFFKDGLGKAKKRKNKLGGWLDFQTTPILSWLQQGSQDSCEAHITMCQNGKYFAWNADKRTDLLQYTGRTLDWQSNETKVQKTAYLARISPNKTFIMLVHNAGLVLLPGLSGNWRNNHKQEEAMWTELKDHARDRRISQMSQKYRIQAIDFIADSIILPIAFQGGMVELLNVLSGETIARFREGGTEEMSMATSPNSYCLATVSNSVDVILWDTECCKTMDEALSHIGSADFIAASHDNTWVLSIPYSTTTKETLCLWNVHEADIVHFLPAPQDTTTLLARFSHDSKNLLFLSRDCTLSTLEISSGRLVKTQRLALKGLVSRYLPSAEEEKFHDFSLACYAADMSPDLAVLAAMVVLEEKQAKCAICLWEIASGRQIGFFGWDPVSPISSSLEAGPPNITNLETLELAFSSDGKQIAAMFGTWITVYDTDTGAKLSELSLKTSSNKRLPCDIVGDALGSFGYRTPSYERKMHTCLNSFKQTLSFSPNGDSLSMSTTEYKLSVWNIDTMRIDNRILQRTFHPPTSTLSGRGLTHPVMSRNWKYEALIHNKREFNKEGDGINIEEIVVYGPDQYSKRALPIPKGSMKLLAFSTDSRLLVAMSSAQFTVWDIAKDDLWQVAHNSRAFMDKEEVKSIYVSSSPARLFASTSNWLVCVWDLNTGICIKQYQGRPGTRYHTRIPWNAPRKYHYIFRNSSDVFPERIVSSL